MAVRAIAQGFKPRDTPWLGHRVISDAAPQTITAIRLREACCFIHCDMAIDTAEASLCFFVVVQTSLLAAAREVVDAIVGVDSAELVVHPFYLENFIIYCGFQAIRDLVLASAASLDA